VVRVAYTTDPEDRPQVAVDGLNKAVGVILVVLIIIMGTMPAQIIALADTAVKSIM
jgi:NADH-quinone oxidoreductase subunit N